MLLLLAKYLTQYESAFGVFQYLTCVEFWPQVQRLPSLWRLGL